MAKGNGAVWVAIGGALLLSCMLSVSAAEYGAADFPAGSYRDGGFIATFTRDGELVVKEEEAIKAEAFYKVDGDLITFIEKDAVGQCAGAGKYRWRFDGRALTFARVEDDCEGRARHLTSRAWPKVKPEK